MSGRGRISNELFTQLQSLLQRVISGRRRRIGIRFSFSESQYILLKSLMLIHGYISGRDFNWVNPVYDLAHIQCIFSKSAVPGREGDSLAASPPSFDRLHTQGAVLQWTLLFDKQLGALPRL